MKTNAVRQLDRMGIGYELREYAPDAEDNAEDVAQKIGLAAAKVFKTLVVRGDRTGVLLAVLPADAELDLKALAQASGNRKVETVALREVQPLTGYVRGGVTALACRKDYPVYLDRSAEQWDVISVSAGMRGMQVLLTPADYARSVGALPAVISRPKSKPTD
jgi:Cys-tRNA(Pro)/Cys-tRNA(Cys) deacylase